METEFETDETTDVPRAVPLTACLEGLAALSLAQIPYRLDKFPCWL